MANSREHKAMALIAMALGLAAICTACTRPTEPVDAPAAPHDGSLRTAALDYFVGDLSDPGVLAKYADVDLLIVEPYRFWGRSSDVDELALIRAVNPDVKVLAYFRTKCVRLDWDNDSEYANTYGRDLFEASRPYWARTTTGDTVQDWRNVVVFDQTDPAARSAMLDVFARYQATSANRFDGVFWDYFSRMLWIAPDVTGMEGDPDLDDDGVGHWDDADEIAAFQASQEAWAREMRAVMGDRFIQVANGARALADSNFAGLFDGMFYELFPTVGFGRANPYADALDPSRPNNLWAAAGWPRRSNGGPWLILSNKSASYIFTNQDGESQVLDIGDLNRAVALLTGATAIHYDLSGTHRAGIPSVKLSLGAPLGGVSIDGDVYSREFERGRIELTMGSGALPFPFEFTVLQNEALVQEYRLPFVYP